MIDNESKRAVGMEPMEIMGALSVRLIHDLTNHLTILTGNAQVLEMVRDNPERLNKVTERIRNASDAAGELLDRFSRFRSQLRFQAGPTSVEDCLHDIETMNPMPGNWVVRAGNDCQGRIDLEARWVAFAVWEIAILAHSAHGSVNLSTGAFPKDWKFSEHVPMQIREGELFRCELVWRSSEPWLDEKEAAKPTDLDLATVYELAKTANGWNHYHYQPDGEHHFNMFVPLAR